MVCRVSVKCHCWVEGGIASYTQLKKIKHNMVISIVCGRTNLQVSVEGVQVAKVWH